MNRRGTTVSRRLAVRFGERREREVALGISASK